MDNNNQTIINTPLVMVADLHVPFDYSGIPDLTPDCVDPAMRSLPGRTIAVMRLYAQGELAGHTYRWDITVDGIDSVESFGDAVERSCEWLLPNSLKLAASDLIRLHDAQHIVLADRAAPLEAQRFAHKVAV